MDAFVDPLTGQLLDADTDVDALSTAVNKTYEEIDRLRQAVRPLQERRAELRGPAALPARRHRTSTQDLIAVCPRCGGTIPGAVA